MSEFTEYLNNIESALKFNGFKRSNKTFLVVPLGDILRGFYFDWKKDRLYVSIIIQPLYVSSHFMTADYGGRVIGNHSLGDLFLWDKDNKEFTKKEIYDQMMNLYVPFIAQIDSPDMFFNKFKNKFFYSLNTMADLVCTAYYIDSNIKDELMKIFFKSWEASERKHLEWMVDLKNKIISLEDAAKIGNTRIGELFSEWRKETIRNLKLENF